MAICSENSHPFGFPSRSKHPYLETLNFHVTILRNKDKKVSFIQVDEDGALERYHEFTKTCHNTNTIVQTRVEDAYSIIGKSKIPNNTLANITRALVLKSINKK